jgi:hypothetical protein
MPLRRWLRTTPGRLRVASIALLGGLLVLGIVAATAASARGDAARSVGSGAAPELVSAEELYGALADADATASIIYLKAGREAPSLRDQYEHDLVQAGDRLAALANAASSSATERSATQTISEQLPIYSGYVESARTNSRFGYPVGAAYLRQASTLMHGQLLPAATTLYSAAESRLGTAYRSGTSTGELILVLAVGLLLVALLIAVQLFVTRRSHRLLNVGLAAGTAVVVLLLGWTAFRFVSAQHELVAAQQKGSDSVQLLSAARILSSQAQADENTALIERGSGQAYVADFATLSSRLGGRDGTGGLLGQERVVAARTGSQSMADQLVGDFKSLLATHADIRRDDDGGNYQQAVVLATGDEASLLARMDSTIDGEITHAQSRLDGRAANARNGFGALALAIPVLLLAAAFLVVIGLQQRIKEYR